MIPRKVTYVCHSLWDDTISDSLTFWYVLPSWTKALKWGGGRPQLFINWCEFTISSRRRRFRNRWKYYRIPGGRNLNSTWVPRGVLDIKYNFLHFIDKVHKNKWGDDLPYASCVLLLHAQCILLFWSCLHYFTIPHPKKTVQIWNSSIKTRMSASPPKPAFLKVFLKWQIITNWENTSLYIFFSNFCW